MITSSLFRAGFRRFPIPLSAGAAFVLALASAKSDAEQLKEARVSQVVKDVKLLPAQAAPRPASVSDPVHNGTAVRTGIDSRAELTFTDATLARLGANTIFSFNEGTRNLDLGGGAMLLRVPKNSGGARINTAAVTAAITGTTIMLEYHPDAYIKFIVLEGTGRIFRNNRIGQSVLLHAGQMLIVNPNGEGMPDPVDVDLDRLLRTSLLINGFRPLPSNDLIAGEIQHQLFEKSGGELVDTNLVIFGRGTAVTLLDPTYTNQLDQANANDVRKTNTSPAPTPTPTMTPTPTATMTVTPTPTPSKFGTPVVITSPNPYVVTAETTITTDPTITTNGQTDFGKIYSGPTLDGSASAYLFTSTSAFDQLLGFDAHFQDVNLLPLAVFKFAGLELDGNPTISTANGGANNLALISVGDITSGPTGGVLTFSGLNSLLLATENGSITLSDNLSFSGIPSLALYARGTGSNLNLNSAITGTTDIFFGAEGSILTDGAFTLTQVNNGLSVGLFAAVFAGIDFVTGDSLTIENDNSLTGNLLVGGTISLTTGRDLTVNGNGILSLTVANNGGAQIGDGGNISVTTGGNLTAGSIAVLVNNRDGGTITNGGSLLFDIGGALTTTGDASFVVSGRDDGGGGGTFGSGANISLTAGSISIGGNLNVGTGLSAGGSAAQATSNVFTTGALTTVGAFTFNIQNGGQNINQMLTGGQVIANDAALSLSAASVSTGDILDVFLNNLDGGAINGNASILFSSAGAVTAGTDATFEIISATNVGVTLTSSIGSDASIAFNSGSFSAGSLLTQIVNLDGATIGGNADLSFSTTGALNSTGNTIFRLLNFDDGQGLGGGTINGDASINVNAGSLASGGLLVARILSQNGVILGDRSVTISVANALTAGGDADFEILDFPPSGNGGTGNFSITVTAGSIGVTGSLNADVNIGSDGAVYLTDNVSISADQDVTVGGLINIFGSLNAGGNVTAGGTITIGGGNLTAGGNVTATAGDITLQLSPTDFGALSAGGSVSAMNLRALTVQAGANITVGSTVGGPFLLEANTVIAGGALNLLDVGTVIGATSIFGPNGGFTPDPFTLSAGTLTVTGLSIPALSFNGTDGGSTDPGNGGSVTLNLTADSLTIGATGDFTSISANGGAFVFGGSTAGGNGGTVDLTTSGDVTVNDAGITADSGANPTGTPHGNGGTVNITSGGTVNVNSVIQTSGNGSGSSNSLKGGNINLTSNKATGVAINVANTGQLLALLDAAAPGPGGKITILATGAISTVDAKGTITADRGTIDIRHTGANGEIYTGGTADFLNAHADVLKVGALGSNGVLTIGNGSLTADSVLKLYAPGSNGTLNFVANVTISSGTDAILAANTVTIQPTVVVNVQGNGGPAQVFTTNPNYSGFGGTNDTNGTFSGNGANNPLPLNQAPPFDGPPGG